MNVYFLEIAVNWIDVACDELIQLITRDTMLFLEQVTDDKCSLSGALLQQAALLIELGSICELSSCPLLKRYNFFNLIQVMFSSTINLF